MLGNASIYWASDNVNSTQFGWTYARMDNGTNDPVNVEWYSQGRRIDDGTWEIVDSGGRAGFRYAVTSYNWSSAVYNYGQSRVQSIPPGTLYASGDVW
jgi:hypothetical protein